MNNNLCETSFIGLVNFDKILEIINRNEVLFHGNEDGLTKLTKADQIELSKFDDFCYFNKLVMAIEWV